MKLKILIEQEKRLLDKKTFSPEQIAKHHNVPLETVLDELKLGIAEEMKEHTSHQKVAEEIALDHLLEDPKYYTNMNERS